MIFVIDAYRVAEKANTQINREIFNIASIRVHFKIKIFFIKPGEEKKRVCVCVCTLVGATIAILKNVSFYFMTAYVNIHIN